ncbi:metabotropic glutamate receptor 3-like isoform X1 [Hydra vulgaris]|uniref:Metabotropic glutamate receptor 3-like isoform X1 n=1 Tax=Hydra vulgaris TaxID=6087 RepID=A0ABM4DN63_HYDVU
MIIMVFFIIGHSQVTKGDDIFIAGAIDSCKSNENEPKCIFQFLYEKATEFAIEEINKNPKILFNHTLKLQNMNINEKISVYRVLSGRFVISIGPYSSEFSEFWSNVLWVGKKSIISYGASSTKFSRRNDYPSIFSTVPSDKYQSKLLLQLALHFNWQTVAILQTQDEDGASMTFNLGTVLDKSICIKHMEKIYPDSKIDEYENAIASLLQHKDIKTVFIFFTYESCKNFFIAAEKYKENLKLFQFVISTSCGTMLNIPNSIQFYFEGMLAIQITNPMPPDFQNYLKLKYKNFNYSAYTPVRPVIKSVNAAAFAIHKWLEECDMKSQNNISCAQALLSTDNIYINTYLSNITENNLSKIPMFNEFGCVEDSYDIFQYTQGEFKVIGFWNHSNTTALQIHPIIPLEESICSSPCKENQIQIPTTDCCWSCSPCNPEDIIKDNVCVKCAPGTKTNKKQRVCYPLPLVSMNMNDSLAYIVFSISSTTILLSVLLIIVYLNNHNKYIIREGNTQLCSLVGVIFMSITPLLYIQKPSIIACHAQKIMFGMPLTLCYAPLVLKTNRIYRTYLSSDKPKLRGLILISMPSQILLILGMVGIQLTMAVFWVVNSQPVVLTEFKPNHVEQVCNSSSRNMTLNAVFPCVLMLSCAYWAFKTRNLPETYNEIKSIAITMYITVFLSTAGLAVAYVLDSQPKQLYTLCFTYQAISIVTLYGLYAMKIIKMYFRKLTKKNKRKKELDTIMNQLAIMSPTLSMMSGIYERKNSSPSITTTNSTVAANN